MDHMLASQALDMHGRRSSPQYIPEDYSDNIG